jgi:PAS domain S-box-containing protein
MQLDRRETIPRVRTRGSEAAAETAFALLDGVWVAPVAMAFLDRDLRFVQVNDAFARLTGAPVEAHAGRAPRDLFPDGELAARAEERLRAVVDSGRPALDLAASSRALDGVARSWRASLYPVFATGGQVRGVCAVVDETTGVRKREAELERARAAADRNARRVALLQGVTSALSAAVAPANVAAAIIAHVREATDAAAVSLRTLEAEGLVPLAAEGLHAPGSIVGRVIPRDAALPVTDAVRAGQAVWIESAEVLSTRYPHLVQAGRDEGYESCAALPLRTRGRTLGTLSLMFRGPRPFDLEERAYLLGIAEQCAQALDRAQLFEAEGAALAEARSAADRLAALQAVTAALARTRTPSEVAEVLVDSTTLVLGTDVAVAYFLDPGGRTLSIRAQRGLSGEQATRYGTVSLDAPYPAATAVRTGDAGWFESWDEAVAAFPEMIRGEPAPWGVGAVVAVPLRVRGSTLGAISLWFRRARRFEPEVRLLLASVADQCGQALDRTLLLEAERAQRASADHDRAVLDAIFENAPLGIGLFDRDLRFVRVNPVLAQMNGAPPEAHVGRLPPEVIPGLPWDEIGGGLRRVIETGVPRLDAPVAVPGPDGKERQFLEAWYPVRAGGDTVGIGTIVREVTAERDAEEFQRNVLGIVGHDVRSPLAAVATAAHLLARGDPLGEKQTRLVERIRAGASRIEQVVAVLIDYAQARRERGIPVQRRTCDVAALCRDVAAECEAANPGRTVRCRGDAVALGEWDPDRLGQALANLVSNALDYSPPESVVDVSWRASDGEVEIAVANEGTPIPAETLGRMFEPFRRGKRERAGGKGLGLGLFIARAIVVAHGGSIEARSDAERTAFTVRLPRRPPAA